MRIDARSPLHARPLPAQKPRWRMIAERGGRAQTTAGPQQRVDRRRGGIGDREQGSACEGAGDTVPVRDLRPSRSERVCRALARAGATGEHRMGGRDRLLQQDMRAAEIPLSEDTLHQHAAQQDSATERGQSLLDRTARMEKELERSVLDRDDVDAATNEVESLLRYA